MIIHLSKAVVLFFCLHAWATCIPAINMESVILQFFIVS